MADYGSLKERAYADFARGDFESSLSTLRQIEREVGLDAELANDEAVTLYKLGQLPEALDMFRRSSQLGGDSIVVSNALELLEEQTKKMESQRTGLQLQPQAPAPAPVEAQAAQPAPEAASGQEPSQFDEFGKRVVGASLKMWQSNSAIQLHHAARALSDEQWAEVLYGSVEGQQFGDFLLPGFIDEEMQRMFVGSSGVFALKEGYQFIRVVLDYMEKYGRGFNADTHAVDFGSGWGRYTRFMLKYVHPDHLYGLDVDSSMIEHCRKSFGMANFMTVGSYPPCDLRDDLIDLAFGYSVFSHLAPPCADSWIMEFARISRPGALIMMTTQGRTFIEYCREIRESGNRSHPWYVSLAESFVDVDKAYAEYDSGAFMHVGHGQYGGTYGESMVSRGYIEQNWLEFFDLVDFIDDRNFLPQALFVLRRK